MKPPEKPYALPHLPVDRYYATPLLAFVAMQEYNEDKISWEEVLPHIKEVPVITGETDAHVD